MNHGKNSPEWAYRLQAFSLKGGKLQLNNELVRMCRMEYFCVSPRLRKTAKDRETGAV